MAKQKKNTAEVERFYPHPREQDRLFGHQEIETQLKELYEKNRLPHALLFCGHEGVGKATLAYRFAKYILSESHVNSPQKVEQLISQNSYSDCLVLEPQTAEETKSRRMISVDDVRDFSKRMHETSSTGGWRVAIIDPADSLNANAANALLKILEEPPPRCLFILISHQPAKLLPTIRSRCQKFAFSALDDAVLGSAANYFSPDLEKKFIDEAISHSQGCIGRLLDFIFGKPNKVLQDMDFLLQGLPKIDHKQMQQVFDQVQKSTDDVFVSAIEKIQNWIHQKSILALQAGNIFFANKYSEQSKILASESQKVRIYNLDRKVFLLLQFENLARLLKTSQATHS